LLLLGLFELLEFVSLLSAPASYASFVRASLAALSLWAAWQVWMRSASAHLPILLLGVVFALTHLIEGFVLGIRPWLIALLGALGWGILAVLVASRLQRLTR
jgi:hypothetical protein